MDSVRNTYGLGYSGYFYSLVSLKCVLVSLSLTEMREREREERVKRACVCTCAGMSVPWCAYIYALIICM